MISIIILVRNDIGFITRCLDSIIKSTETPYELVLIVQGTVGFEVINFLTYVKEKLPETILIYNPVNTGVTPGRNQGISVATGDYLLFFDDDAWVDKDIDRISEKAVGADWLERLLYPFNTMENVGITGQSGTYINPQEPGVFWECKDVYVDCDVVQGYCMLFSKKVVDAIGGLDPYFAKFWHEESEYCLHAKSVGFRVINTRYVGVSHSGSGSGDDGTYHNKIVYMFNKWQSYFNTILVPRKDWKI